MNDEDREDEESHPLPSTTKMCLIEEIPTAGEDMFFTKVASGRRDGEWSLSVHADVDTEAGEEMQEDGEKPKAEKVRQVAETGEGERDKKQQIEEWNTHLESLD